MSFQMHHRCPRVPPELLTCHAKFQKLHRRSCSCWIARKSKPVLSCRNFVKEIENEGAIFAANRSTSFLAIAFRLHLMHTFRCVRFLQCRCFVVVRYLLVVRSGSDVLFGSVNDMSKKWPSTFFLCRRWNSIVKHSFSSRRLKFKRTIAPAAYISRVQPSCRASRLISSALDLKLGPWWAGTSIHIYMRGSWGDPP